MFDDSESSLQCVSSFGETFDRRNEKGDVENNDETMDESRVQNMTDLPSSAFRVYNKITAKHRYFPRQWTQEEFEAALPERFQRENEKKYVRENEIGTANKDEDETGLKKNKEEEISSDENTVLPTTLVPSSPFPPKKHGLNEKISKLKAIFESDENDTDCCHEIGNTNSVNELENCEDSQERVRLDNEESVSEDGTEGVVKGEVNKTESTQCYVKTFTSFLDACLQSLLNTEPFVQVLSNSRQSRSTRQSFSPFGTGIDIGKLKDLMNNTPSFEKPCFSSNQTQFYAQNVLGNFYKEVSKQSGRHDEALSILLKSLAENGNNYDGNTQHSVFQGTFCHSTVCQQCETVVRKCESFLFLNPTIPPAGSPENRGVNIKLLSNTDERWCITSHEVPISSGMVVLDLKGQLMAYPEFDGNCEVTSVQIGAVKDSRLEKVFDDTEEVLELQLEPDLTLFAFHVINCDPNQTKTSKNSAQGENSKSTGFTIMSYHLFFNCGLCLNDGNQVSLLMHRRCGGMVCQDCLDEIKQSNREQCPCPICERPIDLEIELCATEINTETDRNSSQREILCAIVFRTTRSSSASTELFGYPRLVSLPRQTTGYHLYRCIGYLLPKELPMKDKTSFTLHKVDKSTQRCSTCSSPDCTGCLIRVDDTTTVEPEACIVVHFHDIREASKKFFGIETHETAQISKTQALFDGILRSCVDASCSNEPVCPKCLNVTRRTSSIIEFPELLVIHLNCQYACKGLPAKITVADVANFFIQDCENEGAEKIEEGLTYQLAAAVLGQDSNSTTHTFKSCVPGFSADKWIIYDEFEVNEMDPTLLNLTTNSVLFYEVVSGPRPKGPGAQLHCTIHGDEEGAVRNDSTLVKLNCHDLHDVNTSATMAENLATKDWTNSQRSKKTDEIANTDHHVPKSFRNQLEPEECFLSSDIDLDKERLETNFYGSHLSLGEIKRDYLAGFKTIPASVLDDMDNISPITTADEWKPENRLVKETKKLVKAVKREDAYGIVCSLKNGADPCLLINDVSALHLAVGIKSDQRRSTVAYLLKYCDDVNVSTADGTTPVHVAAAWGHKDALELLLNYGGDPFELTDLEGNSAFDLAAKDCSVFLQSMHDRKRNSTHFLELSSSICESGPRKVGNLRTVNEQRLEDIVRSNVALPSFVDEHDSTARVHRHWRQRFKSFRNRSSGILKSLRKISSIRRRSRIGVMVAETSGNTLREV